MNEHEPTHLDLFSGVGGFAMAAGWAGFRTIAFSEIDPYASAVLKKHWPDVPNLGDIRRSSIWPDIGDVSLLTGGFPCQPHSLAGKRRGSADDRHLWPAMRDVIERVRPAWVCGENVPGIIGVELDRVLADLEGIGYRVQPIVVPACAVDAPHIRSRVWILAHSNRGDCRTWRNGCASPQGEIPDNQSPGSNQNAEHVAHTAQGRLRRGRPSRKAGEPARSGEAIPDANGQSARRATIARGQHCLWEPEPDVGRVAHGILRRMDRLKALGNAIVPQVAYQILAAIRQANQL